MSMKAAVVDYICRTYDSLPDHPWRQYPQYAVFRHANSKKWFALVMDVPWDKLGFQGTGSVNVINLKINDQFFHDTIIQEKGILPGYHMNKQYWISVLLDGSVPKEKIFDLIDMSFSATCTMRPLKSRRSAGKQEGTDDI